MRGESILSILSIPSILSTSVDFHRLPRLPRRALGSRARGSGVSPRACLPAIAARRRRRAPWVAESWSSGHAAGREAEPDGRARSRPSVCLRSSQGSRRTAWTPGSSQPFLPHGASPWGPGRRSPPSVLAPRSAVPHLSAGLSAAASAKAEALAKADSARAGGAGETLPGRRDAGRTTPCAATRATRHPRVLDARPGLGEQGLRAGSTRLRATRFGAAREQGRR